MTGAAEGRQAGGVGSRVLMDGVTAEVGRARVAVCCPTRERQRGSAPAY